MESMRYNKSISLAAIFGIAALASIPNQALSQYTSDPGVAYGQNICLITTEMGLPMMAAAGVAASPMMGFQGPSRATALRNGTTIMMYLSQFNGKLPDKEAKKMTSTGLRWLAKNCRAGLSQNEYNAIMRDIKAGKI